MVVQYTKVLAMVLDIAELVILCFSLREARIPVIRSTNIKNITAKMTVAIGAKNAAINSAMLLSAPENEKPSVTDCV